MNKVMTERWNKLITPGDTIFHLGDLCFHNKIDPRKLVKILNGNITLIKGNHDKQKTLKAVDRWYKNFPIIIGEFSCLMNHRPIHQEKKFIDPTKYDFFLIGHVHERYKWSGKSLNVGVDQHDFYPLHIDQIYEMLKERKKEMKNGLL